MEALALAREETIERAAEVLLGYGCKHVVITQSSRGCTVFQKLTVATDCILPETTVATHQNAFHVEVNLIRNPFFL